MSNPSTPNKPSIKSFFFEKLGPLSSYFKKLATLTDRQNSDQSLSGELDMSRYVKRVFYVCLFMTCAAISHNIYEYNAYQKERGTQIISRFNSQLDDVFHRYFSMLYGIRAVFSLTPLMPERLWKPYADQILFSRIYPGLYSISVVRSVQPDNLEEFLGWDKVLNKRDLKVRSAKPIDYSKDLAIIQYSMRADRRVGAEGLEVSQFIGHGLEKARQMDKAQIVLLPSLSREKPTDETGVFILIVPMFSSKAIRKVFGPKPLEFNGWSTSPVRLKGLFNSIIESHPDFQNLTIGLYKPGTNTSFFACEKYINTTPITLHKMLIEKDIARYKFDMRVGYRYPGFSILDGRIAIPLSIWQFVLVCLIISFLVTFAFWSVLNMRKRALDLANHMTSDLLKQEQKYHNLINNAPGVIFSCTPGYNWQMNYLSDQFKTLTGYDARDFLENKRRYIEIIHPADITKIEKTIGLAPEIGHEYFLDYRLIHANGSVRWMHERAKVVKTQFGSYHLTGHFFDITEQKNKEEEYRNLANALENAVDGVAFIDDQGKHTRVNEAYAEIFSCTPSALRRMNFYKLIGQKDSQAVKIVLDSFEDQARETLKVEVNLDGRTIHLSLVIVPAFNESLEKRLVGFYVFAKDISGDMRREVELMDAMKAAEAANQTKSTFLATMSHELRTPLNAIIGYSDMLIEDLADQEDEMVTGDLKKINNAGRHLLSLINDILDVSKLEAGKMTFHLETFNVKEILDSIDDMMKPLAEKNGNKLEIKCPSDAGTMHSDVTKIRQIIFNLLSNACKFTKEGKVTLTVTSLTKENREYLSFAVKDTGIGITEEQLARLFKPFSQADSSTTRNFGGTGLGLTITKKFTELLEGAITVETEYGEGTVFTVTLPRNTRQEFIDRQTGSNNIKVG